MLDVGRDAAATFGVCAIAKFTAVDLIARRLIIVVLSRRLDHAAQRCKQQNREQKFPLHTESILFYLGA